MLKREGDVAGLYDRWSGSYDGDRNPTRDLAARALRKTAPSLADRAVVELGCGTGRNSVWLAERAGHVVGLDISRGMLEEARRRAAPSAVELVRADVTAPLPFGDATVGVVVVMLVLEHVASAAGVVVEAARILEPGGELLICEYHPYRQLAGGQARFRDEGAGREVRIPAFLHMIDEYVDAGLHVGLELAGLREWLDPEDGLERPPRVVSLHWRKA